MTQRTLAWLPAHPAMGWASMNRYWLALHQCQQQMVAKGWQIHCPLKLPLVEQPAAPAWQRWLVRKFIYPAKVRALRADAVHVLDHSFSDMLRYLRPGIRRLVTVHDLIPLYDSTGLSQAQVTGFRQRVSHMTQAEKLLAVSRYTQQCISEQFPTAVSRTQVLPLGVELPPLVQHARSCSILSVGSTLTRKNLHILPQVFQQLREKGLSPSLIRIGAKLPTTLKSELLRVMGDSPLHELGFVSDTELFHQYATAGLVIFPSTMEGFGLPVLEAMAHGCPVVSSTATSLPEVAGEAALLFDPQDASTAAEHCHNILSQSAVSDKMARQGRARAEELSWSIHWQSLLHQYEEAMS